eukprot:CAMPEP_0202978128 /NCGR_PEP_ID=MMETSP1396-20130829/84656_1 /ASSEMBLY_ACC=CAM_ASM_000872 /TAXON_ID= /ORGANISM="Pseudokeronopsis sp., Strain Brazil" /LENGTH=72 /DNA_ID=CAMNT_0049716999 /DNA_START=662 /DNA_END=880 /DNA_ORIENTATION=+
MENHQPILQTLAKHNLVQIPEEEEQKEEGQWIIIQICKIIKTPVDKAEDEERYSAHLLIQLVLDRLEEVDIP